VNAADLAVMLLGSDYTVEVYHMGVRLEALAVEPPGGRLTSEAFVERVFVVRALSWPALRMPDRSHPPSVWCSEVMTLPRRLDHARHRLIRLEAEYALRAFLYRVERDIDRLLRHAADHARPAAESAATGPALGVTGQ
jgi:hypothetical protein